LYAVKSQYSLFYFIVPFSLSYQLFSLSTTPIYSNQQQQETRLNGRHVGEGATLQQKSELNSLGRRKIHSLIFEKLALFFIDVIFSL